MKDEIKLFLYTTAHMSEKDGKKVFSHYLPFVAMDDGAAVQMVKQAAKNLEDKVITQDKYLFCVGVFYPDRPRPIAGCASEYRQVASFDKILGFIPPNLECDPIGVGFYDDIKEKE